MRYCERCDKLYCLDCASFSGCGGVTGCRGKSFCKDCQLQCEMCNRTSCAVVAAAICMAVGNVSFDDWPILQ